MRAVLVMNFPGPLLAFWDLHLLHYARPKASLALLRRRRPRNVLAGGRLLVFYLQDWISSK